MNYIALALVTILSGCDSYIGFDDEKWSLKKVSGNAVYTDGDVKLVLNHGIGMFYTDSGKTTKNYDVVDNKILIHISDHVIGEQKDMKLFVSDDRESLVCSNCGYYGFDVNWKRVETVR